MFITSQDIEAGVATYNTRVRDAKELAEAKRKVMEDIEPPTHINIKKNVSEFTYDGMKFKVTTVYGDPSDVHKAWTMRHPIVRAI